LIRFTYGPNQGCGGNIDLRNSASSVVQSLDADNDGLYEPNLNCQWLVLAQPNKVIRLTFSQFNVETTQNDTDTTCWDYLEVPFCYIVTA
jgi:hypothetical protein